MQPTLMKAIEDTTYKIRKKHDDMYIYLIQDYEILHEYDIITNPVQMVTSFNSIFEVQFKIPKKLLHPPNFEINMYPLNHNKSNFCDDRPFNYLCNFNWYNFLQLSTDDIGVHRTMISDLINMSSQTRYSNIWANVSGIVMYLRMYEKGYYLRFILCYILKLWSTFPFFDTWDGFKDILPNTSTMWPLLLYAFMSVCFDYICDNITEGEAILCFNNHLNDAIDGYQDKKLATKSGYTLWLKHECDRLTLTLTPKYDYTGVVYSNFMKSTKEIVQPNEFKENEEHMKNLLHPEFYEYIKHMRLFIKNVEDIIKLYTICLCGRDDRTYYGTLMELAIDKAIKPQVAGSIVPKPIPRLWMQRDKKLILAASYPSDSFLFKMQQFFRLYYPALREKLNVKTLSSSFINFLSTASAGVGIDIPDEILKNIQDKNLLQLMKKGSNKRVLQEAFMVERYNDLEPIINDFVRIIKIVVRKQIERRQRGIAGIPNNVLKINQITYEANKAFSAIARAPSHGKQSGNSRDIHHLLFHTTLEDVSKIYDKQGNRLCKGVVISSADVKGMDTHIQINVALNQQLASIEILDGIDYDVGPFKRSTVQVEDVNGKTYEKAISGAQHAISFGIANFSQTTGIESKYFGSIVNQEGTFPSGLLTTSNHHTEELTLAIETAIKCFIEEEQSYVSLSDLHILGDDISIVLHGDDDSIVMFMNYLVTKFSSLGLTLERDESRNFGVFLQQHVINGRFNGFANRIALFTTEDYKTRKSVRESCTEYNALVDDIIFRTYNVNNLIRFQRIHQFVVMSKYVFRVSNLHYDRLIKLFSKRLNVFEYDQLDNKKNSFHFLGIQIPYSYFQCYGGGEIPPESWMRNDGSFTKEYSIYSPRGEWLRKFFYDLSNGEKLDHEMLSIYKFDICDFFIQYNILDVQEEVRDTVIDRSVINKLALNLESLENTNERSISRRASNILLNIGVKIPANGVYGYQVHERLIKVLQNIKQSDYELKQVGDRMFQLCMTKFLHHKVIIKHNDRLHVFTLQFSSTEKIPINKKMRALYNISISKNLKPFSDGWMLYTCLDHTYDVAGDLATALAHSQGHFKNFQYDRDTFITSTQIANKYGINSVPMSLFFESVNVSDETKVKWIQAIEYFVQFKEFVYPYSINPRRLFFIPDQASSVSNVLSSESIPCDVHYRALMFRRAYAYVLSHPYEVSDSRAIFVDGQVS